MIFGCLGCLLTIIDGVADFGVTIEVQITVFQEPRLPQPPQWIDKSFCLTICMERVCHHKSGPKHCQLGLWMAQGCQGDLGGYFGPIRAPIGHIFIEIWPNEIFQTFLCVVAMLVTCLCSKYAFWWPWLLVDDNFMKNLGTS